MVVVFDILYVIILHIWLPSKCMGQVVRKIQKRVCINSLLWDTVVQS
uniref:Uncharacterized protein n=1 Tax=Setaria viridis TaxID=4556 RepID=A0A4U6TKN6_SETVI|nr:hypothetical protein SEVIR_8G236650v2 [Setaria viridis]